MIFEPAIDRRTEEKMLRGTLEPEDAPPEFARVAVLMRAASAVPGVVSGSSITEADRLRQERVVASMAAVIATVGGGVGTHPDTATPKLWKARRQSAVRSTTAATWKLRQRSFGRARIVLAMTLGMMLASAGLAFAGVLPAPIQHAASVVLSKVGLHVPDDSPGQEPREGGTGGDNGNHKDLGNHTGQEKNGNNGKHTGQDKNGNNGDHGKHKGADKGGTHKGGEGKTHDGDDHGGSGRHGSDVNGGSSGKGGGGGSGHSGSGSGSGDSGDSGHGGESGSGHGGHGSD
jgi:hypothetical protein